MEKIHIIFWQFSLTQMFTKPFFQSCVIFPDVPAFHELLEIHGTLFYDFRSRSLCYISQTYRY